MTDNGKTVTGSPVLCRASRLPFGQHKKERLRTLFCVVFSLIISFDLFVFNSFFPHKINLQPIFNAHEDSNIHYYPRGVFLQSCQGKSRRAGRSGKSAKAAHHRARHRTLRCKRQSAHERRRKRAPGERRRDRAQHDERKTNEQLLPPRQREQNILIIG